MLWAGVGPTPRWRAHYTGCRQAANQGEPTKLQRFVSIRAVLLYAALVRLTRHAARIFSIVAALVLVVSFVPDFTYVPTVPGSSDAQIAILLAMHVVAAAVIVGMLTTATRPRA